MADRPNCGCGKPVSEYPAFTEGQLAAASWAAAATFAVLALFVFSWMLAGEDDVLDVRARSVVPMLTFGIAIVTFLTFMYRSAVVTRQTDEQRRSNDSAERVERAGIFQKGVELLREKHSSSRLAGFESLSAIAADVKREYAASAWEILVEEWLAEASALKEFHPNDIQQAVPWIDRISQPVSRAGLHWRRQTTSKDKVLLLRFPYWQGKSLLWHDGLPHLQYIGVHFEFEHAPVLTEHVFSVCDFRGVMDLDVRSLVSVEVHTKFGSCKFFGLHISKLMTVGNNDFEECDFSECRIIGHWPLSGQSAKSCWYTEGRPPVFLDRDGNPTGLDPTRFFEVRKALV